MTKPTMTSQWDPGNYKPLDMSNIPGYPQQMPFEYINLLPGFSGGDRERADYHMRNFWNFFLSYPVDDYAEDVVMKLFSATLCYNAKEWYDNLPEASITTMEQFEKVFLERWGIQQEDIPVLLEELKHIRQAEDETVRDFQIRFENMLYQIPESHHPEERYLVHLFTRALLGYLSFPLDKITPRMLDEAYYMAAVIEEKISSFDIGCLFTLSTLNGESLFTLESFIIDLQEEGEQTTDRRGIVEEIVEEPEPNNEVSTCPLPLDEAIHKPSPPAQQQDDKVSFFPFQDFDDTLFHDSESDGEMESPNEEHLPCCTTKDKTVMHAKDAQVLEAPAQEEKVSYPPLQDSGNCLLYDLRKEEEMGELLNDFNPPCYDTDTDIADFDEFIHVGRRRWDAVGYDMDPIYDIRSHLQVFPLQLSQRALDQWQQGDEFFTDAPQTPKDDLMLCFPNDFRSYLEDFDDCSSEHLDLFYEDDYQPPLCSSFDRSKNIVCLKRDSHDIFLQPPLITLPCCIIKGVVGNYTFCIEFPLKQTRESKDWLKTTDFSLSSHFFNFPLRVCQLSARSLSIPSQASGHEDVLGSQFADLLSQYSEPWTLHDPFQRWIEYFPQRWTWRDFIPPTRLHELDFMISDDMIHALTHVIFVLDLSLFWFMMKHKGRYCGTLLDWLHWLFDYTHIRPTGKYR
jgi:hypothetical protein